MSGACGQPRALACGSASVPRGSLEAFRKLAGLEDFSADILGQRLHVKYDAAKLSTSAIAGAVADAGMRVWLEHEEPVATTDAAARWRHALVWTSGLCFVAGFLIERLG